MKKFYEQPEVELISFRVQENLMEEDPTMSGELVGGEDAPF